MKKLLLFCSFIVTTLSSHAQQKDLIPVFRYYIPADSSYVTVTGNEDYASSWTNKTLLFYAYGEPGPNRVAVYRWYNPVQRKYVSICADEWRDEQMAAKGYKNKQLQFYALTRQGPRTVEVYRWLHVRNKGWATAPAGDTLTGYDHFRRKTYQYFAVPADH